MRINDVDIINVYVLLLLSLAFNVFSVEFMVLPSSSPTLEYALIVSFNSLAGSFILLLDSFVGIAHLKIRRL